MRELLSSPYTYHHHQQQQQQYKIQFQLHVIHFDHCQRGEESTLDRLLVQQTCHEYQIPCYIYLWNQQENQNNITSMNPQIQTPSSSSSLTTTSTFTQDIARQWRQQQSRTVLQQLIDKEKARGVLHEQDLNHTNSSLSARILGIVCTAHHKDDQEETILLKLLRGVHVSHISGMKPWNPYPSRSSNHRNRTATISITTDDISMEEEEKEQDDEENHIHNDKKDTVTRTLNITHHQPLLYMAKPLLSLRKEEIIQYLQQHGYVWREDASNTSNKYLRNRVRNELIPLLQDLVGSRDILEVKIMDFMYMIFLLLMILFCWYGSQKYTLSHLHYILTFTYIASIRFYATTKYENTSKFGSRSSCILYFLFYRYLY